MNDHNLPYKLTGKTVVITGASSGIGRTTARICSQLGGHLILVDKNEEQLKNTLDSLDNQAIHMAYGLDLNDYLKVGEMVEILKSRKTEVDGMVHAAGISTTLPFKMTTPERMESFFRTNTMSGMNLSREVVSKGIYRKNGMGIIFISSVMGMVGEKGKSLYSMSKGALNAGAKAMAVELAAKNIRVNVVSPGVVETPMSGSAVYSKDENLLQKVREMHPLGLGKPEDVAYACIYLLSDAACWITGSNLVIDGGYTAK